MRLCTSILFRLLVTFACAISTNISALQARPLDEVTASKVLRVVVYRDNAPFSWMERDQVKGIDVDIAHEIARRLGVTAEVIPRMAAEDVDDDLRFNVWKGPYSDGGVGDVMMHVPIDRELMIRNTLVVIGNPYFEERVALAFDPDQLPAPQSFEQFRNHKIGVQYATVAAYFLLRFSDGALIENVVHFTKLEKGIQEFVRKDTAALLGVRSDIEGVLYQMGLKASFAETPMPGLVRKDWQIGTAVKDNSRDLQYAIGAALEDLRTTGGLETIFARHGVTYTPPPIR